MAASSTTSSSTKLPTIRISSSATPQSGKGFRALRGHNNLRLRGRFRPPHAPLPQIFYRSACRARKALKFCLNSRTLIWPPFVTTGCRWRRSRHRCTASPAPATPAKTALRFTSLRIARPELWGKLLEAGAAPVGNQAVRVSGAQHASARSRHVALRPRNRPVDHALRRRPRLGSSNSTKAISSGRDALVKQREERRHPRRGLSKCGDGHRA